MSITLPEWLTAHIDLRGEWLKDGAELDALSREVLSWSLAFRFAGAYCVTDEVMLKVYQEKLKAGKGE